MTKPDKNEYVSFYQPYLDVLQEESLDLFGYLEKSLKEFEGVMERFGPEKGNYRYDHGKWTVKEVVQHLIDAERVFVYRALRFSRQDATVLSGFDENAYAERCNVEGRELSSLIEEFLALRRSTILMFAHLEPRQMAFRGSVEGNEFTVKALGYICSGHLYHHLKVLQERYLDQRW